MKLKIWNILINGLVKYMFCGTISLDRVVTLDRGKATACRQQITSN